MAGKKKEKKEKNTKDREKKRRRKKESEIDQSCRTPTWSFEQGNLGGEIMILNIDDDRFCVQPDFSFSFSLLSPPAAMAEKTRHSSVEVSYSGHSVIFSFFFGFGGRGGSTVAMGFPSREEFEPLWLPAAACCLPACLLPAVTTR